MTADYEYAKMEFEKWFSQNLSFDTNTEEGQWKKGMMFRGYLAGFNRALEIVEEKLAKRVL